jgi:hypothetical protein
MADWGLAGLILEHSDRTVALVRRVLNTEKVRVFAGRGVADAIRESSKASAHTDEVLKAAEQIVAALGKKPSGTMITESELCRDVLSGKLRIYCAEALALLVAEENGGLEEAGPNRKKNMRYRLSEDTDSAAPEEAAGVLARAHLYGPSNIYLYQCLWRDCRTSVLILSNAGYRPSIPSMTLDSNHQMVPTS